MSIQDREWYQEELRRRAQATKQAAPQKAAAQDDEHADAPSDMPGAHWHWSVKLIVVGWALALIGVAIRYVGR
ncbi:MULTISPECIES: hypothetical protein [Ralstonia solanacearum species complex]|uniref:Transmembrane protein n=1 Tax=Ralstonia solanacearum TaxID=305 RepID=A0A7X0Q2H9_RALSL|nr:hypothetical protein [Ralstonia solanacearum]ATJ88627.1 hypothetical protein CDC59_20550 [Ralstonia solanacearum]KFX81801.1 hypothetical protein KR99_20905 [Ralstonia solanacearum]MBB6584167.1 hypothetical protein [Ralstonia solanacearum]MBB6593141.1 hypothetical protein [Ralstonia solanacearum]MBB6597368.1 hypothetical protein [Ralstonia solanacearum]